MSRTVGVPWRHTRTRGDDRETMSEMDALDVFCARVANDEEPAWRLVVKMLRRADRPQGADEDASAAVRGIAASLIPIADALSERRREATAFRTASARAMNGATALEKVSRVEASAATTRRRHARGGGAGPRATARSYHDRTRRPPARASHPRGAGDFSRLPTCRAARRSPR